MKAIIDSYFGQNQIDEPFNSSDEELMSSLEPHGECTFPFQGDVQKVFDGLIARSKLTVEKSPFFRLFPGFFVSGLKII